MQVDFANTETLGIWPLDLFSPDNVYEITLSGVIWPKIKGQGMGPTSRGQLENVIKQLHVFYTDSLQKGFTPAETPANPAQAAWIASRSGAKIPLVIAYLEALDSSSRAGKIPAAYYNPKGFTTAKKDDPTILKSVGGFLNSQLNTLKFVALAAGALYIYTKWPKKPKVKRG